nr:hypothetical protein [uncultured Methanospirillum sp.]
MNWKFILSGGVFLVLAGLVGGDFVSTSISTDGTVMPASSGNTENGSFASRVMAVVLLICPGRLPVVMSFRQI